MQRGAKVFGASLLFGYLYWRSLKPRISILNKDAVAGSLSFTMSVEGITFTDTIFLTDDKSIVLAEGNKYWFITEPDEDRTGVNLTIAENLKPGGAYDVVASEWVRVTPFAAISGKELKLKKIKESQLKKIWESGKYIYIQTAPGPLSSYSNLFTLNKNHWDGSMNIYKYHQTPEEYGLPRILNWIREREKNFDLVFYTYNSPTPHIVDNA